MSDNTSTIDPDTFDLDAFIGGTGAVTHTIEVCGKPHLMGRIEHLKAELERPAAADVVDDRPMAKDPKVERAKELEDLRTQMLASITTWTIRSLHNGEAEKIRETCADTQTVLTAKGEQPELTMLDYDTWAAQVTHINGQPITVTGKQLHRMHLGDDKGATGLGRYFLRTIAATANAAARGEGVDVPFSRAFSALVGKS